MDRLSLSILIVGFVLMLGCTTITAYQAVQIARIQQQTLELIVRTHPPVPH